MQSQPIEITDLIIDRNTRPGNFESAVCLNLEGTLLSINRDLNNIDVNNEYTFPVLRHPPNKDFFVTVRPGAVELMVELIKYALPYFYTELSRSEALDITYHLHMNDHHDSDWAEALAVSSVNIPVLSKEHCSETPFGPKKLLGNLSEETDWPINHLWMIDRPSALVDFPSKLITVPEFNGDMSDRHLYDLIERIFIN